MKPQFKPGYKEPYWTAIEDVNPDLLKPDHVSWGWTNDAYDVEKERKGHVWKTYQEAKKFCDAYNRAITAPRASFTFALHNITVQELAQVMEFCREKGFQHSDIYQLATRIDEAVIEATSAAPIFEFDAPNLPQIKTSEPMERPIRNTPDNSPTP